MNLILKCKSRPNRHVSILKHFFYSVNKITDCVWERKGPTRDERTCLERKNPWYASQWRTHIGNQPKFGTAPDDCCLMEKARWRGRRHLYSPKKWSPQKTTPAEDQQIIQDSRSNPKKTSVQIQQEWMPNISLRTVRRKLKSHGLSHKIPASKEALTENHANDRLLFAQMHE